MTWCAAQTKYQLLHFRKIAENPRRCDGTDRPVTLQSIYQGKTVCQCHRLLLHHFLYLCICTYRILEIFPNQIAGSLRFSVISPPGSSENGHQTSDDRLRIVRQYTCISYISEKCLEFFLIFQQGPIYSFQAFFQPHKCRNLIVEKISRLQRIILRIVEFINLQLVVLQKLVVWFLGKQQRRKIQGVDNPVFGDSGSGQNFSDIFQVVIENIMTTNIFRPLQEFCKTERGRVVERRAV